MIQRAELRLGNLVSCDGNIYTVVSLSHTSMEVKISGDAGNPDCDYLSFEPVALNAEWMKQFSGDDKGYLIISEMERESPSSNIRILSTVEGFLHADGFLRVCAYEYERYPDGSSLVPDDVITLGYKHIRYVHQLQNLYHLLTGKELAVK